MMEQNAKEILLALLDEARVPLIWRTISHADALSAFATVTGENSRAHIFVKTYDRPEINIRIVPYGHEFVAITDGDLRTVLDRAVEFVSRWVQFRLITLKDIFGDIADEVEDFLYVEFGGERDE
jgi:hypothetical protein